MSVDAAMPWLAALQFIAFLLASVTLLAILRYRKTRSEPFNMYLVFLLFPDAFANLVFFIAYVNFSQEYYLGGLSRTGCTFWIWTWFFYYACNLWLNVLVAFEVHHLVTRSRKYRRYKPPTFKKILLWSTGIYCFAILWAVWFVIEEPWSPFTMTDPDYCYGEYKSPQGGPISSLASNLILFFSFLLPVVYVVISCIRIRIQKLLPHKGRTRVIFMYFHRIVIVFCCCYLPSAILSIQGLVLPDTIMADWVWVVIDTLIPIQAIVTFGLILSKPDVSKAIRSLLLCRAYQDDSESFLSIMSKGFRMRISTFRSSFRMSGVTGSSSSQISARNEGSAPPQLNLSEWDCEDDFGDDVDYVEGTATTSVKNEKVDEATNQIVDEESNNRGKEDECEELEKEDEIAVVSSMGEDKA